MVGIDSYTDAELKSVLKKLKGDRCKKDLYYLGHNLLNHKEMTVNTHGQLCDLMAEWRGKNHMILMPRGTFKSSVVTDGITINTLLRDPNKKVLIFSETYSKAADYVRHIKEHMEQESFIDVYGDMRDPKFWREDRFRIKGRTKLDKDPSVESGGIDKPLTGKHYSLIICDDILGETNTNTPEQLEKVFRRFQELYSLLENEPDAYLVIVGTIWDEDDLYCRIIKEQEGITDFQKLIREHIHIGKFWNIYHRRAEDDGVYFFPEKLNEEKLAQLSSGQSTEKFMKQYYNDPTRKSNTIFDPEWLEDAKTLWAKDCIDKDGKTLESPHTQVRYLLVDPAISKAETADYSALVVVGDAGPKRYVLEAFQERMDALELVDAILSMAIRFSVRRIIVESVGFQRVLVTMLKQEMRRRGTYKRVVEFQPGTKRDKKSRIELLVPRFKQRQIGYSESLTELDEQIRKFPNLSSKAHDDLIDCLSIGEQEIKGSEPSGEDLPSNTGYGILIKSAGI